MTYEIKAGEGGVDDAAVEAAFVAAGGADVASAEELDALKAEVKALNTRIVAGQRPALVGGQALAAEDDERKAFRDGYLRKGQESAPEVKALATTTGPEGGYAVPQEIDEMIGAHVRDFSPIRQLATVVGVGSANYRKLVVTGGIASGWISETAPRPETAATDFAEIAPPMGELYANPAATQTMLDDAAFDVERWLAGEIGAEFAQAEGAAFVAGSGVAQPKGFLTYAHSDAADGVRAFGTLQHVDSGVDGGIGDADVLIDLVHSLKAPLRQGAAFVMNAGTLAAVRKLKTTDGDYVWRAGIESGQPGTLLGHPVVEAAAMPDVASGETPIAFGNFKAGYVIAERTATRILRDPYSNKPYVHFYATKRVGGAVSNSEAIKLLRCSV
ncbi:MAG: phage major capsid protein [Pacificimonas sp.]|jgi:HK97 family phage major capsid protein|nr:phage major capsid protein [Pacificimonas sp.]